MKISRVAVLFCVLALLLRAQEFRATITGSVTDTSGAGIANVKVTATEVKTGTASEATSDANGKYTIPFLLPGTYEVTASSAGFSTYRRSGITLGSGDQPVIDIQMQVGQQSTTVSVSAEVPLVNNADASAGQTINSKEVENLPVNGRTPLVLAQLSMGVLPEAASGSLVHPFDNGAAAAISIAGSKIQSTELLMDGAPDATWDGRVAYNPPMDAVQQVTVDIFDSDAAFGHTGSGTANQITKSGTNSLHGTLYEFNENNFTSANNFFSNASGKPVPVLHFNQYGLTVGGPVWIPKVINGKDKLFWFFAWEGLKDNTPTPITTTVPTQAERNGDFSALLNVLPTPKGAAYNPYQFFNPYSGTQSGSTINRKPFTNNVLPANLLNPVALAYLKYYPLPNQPGLANGENNYFVNGPSIDNFDNEFGRLDYNVGNNDKIFFDFRHNNRFQNKNNLFNNLATGSTLTRENWGSTLDEVHTFGGASVLDVRANWTRFNEVHSAPSAGFDPTTLGFPSYISSNSTRLQLPFISFGSCGSYTSFQCLGDTGSGSTPSESYQIFGTLEKVVGNHTLKFGADTRRYDVANIAYGASAGTFTFGTNWVQGPTATSAAPQFGGDFASFLLGLPTAGSYNIASDAYLKSYYYALFLQDNWRLRRNLTLNLGIRFERDLPQTERYNRMVNGFDASTPNPIAGAAQAAYAANYSSYVKACAGQPSLCPPAPSNFAVNGGLTYATPSNPEVYQTTSHRVSPRIGFSWSPERFHDKTVIRGGFGIFVAPITLVNIAANGNVSSSPIVNQEGFSQSTSFTATTNNYLTPANTLTSPFGSNPILQPVGSSLGLAAYVGQSISFLAPKLKSPYSERWEFDIQQQLSPQVLFEVAYIGNRSNDIPIPQTELDALPRQLLSTSNYRDASDNALAAFYGQTVANPFYNIITSGSLTGKTTSLVQLLAPYPQYPVVSNGGALSGSINGIVMQNNTAGSSWFNSLNVRIQKRTSNGLTLIGNYMYSKFMEQDDYLNDTDLAPETRVSPFDHPHHISIGFSYELPVGHGKAFDLRRKWANAIVGGWVVNGVYQWEIGAPLFWGAPSSATNYVYCPTPSSACNGFGGPLNFNPVAPNAYAFNRSAFDTASADQPVYSIRTFPTTFGTVRLQNFNNLDASLLKNFNVTESKYFQLRFETYNTLNHPIFGAPSVTSPTSSTFGLVNTTSNNPRAIQLGARFVF